MSTVFMLSQLEVMPILEENKLASFLDKIQNGYHHEVEYHNDLHGVDVMQMSYRMLTKGGLMNTLKLNKLDALSLIIASVCHDLGHDGFNNSYHTNAVTQRAIDCNDVSVQESFHAAQTFRYLSQPENNFIEQFS